MSHSELVNHRENKFRLKGRDFFETFTKIRYASSNSLRTVRGLKSRQTEKAVL